MFSSSADHIDEDVLTNASNTRIDLGDDADPINKKKLMQTIYNGHNAKVPSTSVIDASYTFGVLTLSI